MTVYTTGTITLTNGSAVVTGTDTAWQLALIVGGTIFVQADGGNPLPIASVESNTQILAALQWTGDDGTYAYAIQPENDVARVAKNAETLARIIAEMDSGIFWKYDQSGDTAGRALYDTREKGFSYLDVSTAQPRFWVKRSTAAGDWAGPFAYGTGPVGPAPSLSFSPVVTGAPGTPASLVVTGSNPKNLAFTIPAGLTGIRWRGAYSSGTSYLERDGVRDNGSAWIARQDTVGNAPPVLPVTSNAFWELFVAKGTDGTGTGDVVGPASSGDARIAVFDGLTGKVLKDGGKSISEIVPGNNSVTNAILADMATATIKGRVAGGAGDPQDLSASQALSVLKTAGAYAKDNILGTVSFAGGVPSGAVLESGTTPTGEYVKFANGWMICTHQINAPGPTVSAAGAIFMSTATAAMDFPVPFVSRPSVHVDGMNGGGNGWILTVFLPTATSWGSYRTASYQSDSSTAGIIFLTAVGRWV